MSQLAELKIASGPDRGKVFPLTEETVHIGSSEDNEIVLEDDTLAETHLSIAHKNGRYAIYTPFEGAIEIDGNPLPSEQWIWLPFTARIQLTSKTLVLFEQTPPEAKAPPATAKKAAPQPQPADATQSQMSATASTSSETASTTIPAKSQKKAKVKKGSQSLAKFITNREGDPLVQLGADGKLPELNLYETNQPVARKAKKQASNPNLLYAILAGSFFASLMLLLADFSVLSKPVSKIRNARSEINRFYEKSGTEPQEYQLELRKAELAHARGDLRREKLHYRNILFMLQAQDVNPLKGITGDGPAADEELKSLVISLLGKN